MRFARKPSLRTAILFARQVKDLLHLLAVVDKIPLLDMVVGPEHRDHHMIHVPRLRTLEIGGIDKVEGDGFTIRRSAGLHSRLVSDAAIMSKEQTIRSVEVNHGDHVFAMTHDFAHQRGSSRGHAKGYLDRLALRAFSFPGTGERFQLVE